MRVRAAGFHRYVIVVILFAVMLIWWGAATTTTNAGMVFADWPLSQGSLNPPGWLHIPPFMWEHGHRLIATAVGLLTAGMFAWCFISSWKRALEFVLLLAGLGAIVGFLGRGAGIRRMGEDGHVFWFWAAAIVGTGALVWLIVFLLRKNLSMVTKLSGLALMVVSLQAVLGGLRVTEISDTFAVMHGCLAQGFFCLLILIAMMSSRRWTAYTKETLGERQLHGLRTRTLGLLVAVFGQLILGATMRHTHRLGLADDGILTTGGVLFPGFGDFDLGILFSHKVWALVVLAVSTAVSVFATRRLGDHPSLRRHSYWIVGLVVVQLGLGALVIASGKGFWITNFHVLTGLTILALTFALAVRSFAATKRSVRGERGRARVGGEVVERVETVEVGVV
ncbi:MAG: COX15/CtaA family protein [Verrucomicrobiota bacterium]